VSAGADRRRLRWAVAFLIGLATLTATGFGWRAAQIGSTAAYDDRQSVSETVRVEQEALARTIAVASQAREYARYRADYAVAASLDREADRLAAAGAGAATDLSRTEAVALREGATRRAVAAGVFGAATIGDDLLAPRATPRPFDPGGRARALAAEQATELGAARGPGPDHWARSADEIRDRTAGLVRWACVVLGAVLVLTVAEVTPRLRRAWVFAAAGVVVYIAGTAGGLSTVFFA
jgi:hypothetical protein